MDNNSVKIKRNILTENARLRDVMQVMNAGVNGIVLIVDRDDRLTGVFTDGDIRRALLDGAKPETAAIDYMNRNFIAGPASGDRQSTLSRLSESCRHLPLLDDDGRPIDLISWAEIWRVGVSAPHLGGNEMKYINDCIVNGWISSQGQYVRMFEESFADYLGTAHAISTSSGTTALHLALTALEIGAGDEVILPNITFGASANTVLQCGAKPVFVDVDMHSWTMDPHHVTAAITPHTRAIMPVHIYGHPCDMDALLEIARFHNLLLIEDCAESLGATYRGRLVGGFGHIGCFSFFANKVITTGEGGMVVTDDARLAERLRLLCNHGMDPKRRYWHLIPGFNYRMTNLQAAVGLAQLERIDKFLTRRRQLAEAYDQMLGCITGLELQPHQPWAGAVCWLYTLLVDETVLGIDRDYLMRHLAVEGIDTRPLFSPLSEQPAYGGGSSNAFPISRRLADRGLSLPTSNAMTNKDVERISKIISQIVEDGRAYSRAMNDKAFHNMDGS